MYLEEFKEDFFSIWMPYGRF